MKQINTLNMLINLGVAGRGMRGSPDIAGIISIALHDIIFSIDMVVNGASICASAAPVQGASRPQNQIVYVMVPEFLIKLNLLTPRVTAGFSLAGCG
ncbi:MAG: hypothetical protein IT297_05035 [Anaerolineae bacterium]|jgi:hypothetical protein|nr:hypothetical protein [Anaerolineae bacterium]MCZ7553003.1 hypothetical protein [Anaerolineales bacterium]